MLGILDPSEVPVWVESELGDAVLGVDDAGREPTGVIGRELGPMRAGAARRVGLARVIRHRGEGAVEVVGIHRGRPGPGVVARLQDPGEVAGGVVVEVPLVIVGRIGRGAAWRGLGREFADVGRPVRAVDREVVVGEHGVMSELVPPVGEIAVGVV
ncbi:MAG: hypothetical protein LC798_20555 [Chloroflexi bacterium]|nr:hypothetical protein [Chloroflexota bacterium]